MRAGSAPASMRRSSRSISSFVLPVPAWAETNAEANGSEAACWAAPARKAGDTAADDTATDDRAAGGTAFIVRAGERSRGAAC